MGNYRVGVKWLTENRIIPITESPESELDKAVEKHVGAESFGGAEMRIPSLRKKFVSDSELDQGEKAQSAGEAQLDKLGAKLKGKIFAGAIFAERGGKVSVELAVMGGNSEAKKAWGFFIKEVTANIPGFSFGEMKVKGIESAGKADSGLIAGGHPLTNFVTIIHGIMPFTVSTSESLESSEEEVLVEAAKTVIDGHTIEILTSVKGGEKSASVRISALFNIAESNGVFDGGEDTSWRKSLERSTLSKIDKWLNKNIS
jgi:hypothetical protein